MSAGGILAFFACHVKSNSEHSLRIEGHWTDSADDPVMSQKMATTKYLSSSIYRDVDELGEVRL
jgi:hypothetical protein